MGPRWVSPGPRSSADSTDAISFETVATPHAETSTPWVLFVGSDETALERAAHRELTGAVVSPPTDPPLPITAHTLPPPGLLGERTLYLPRFERGLFDGIGCVGSLLYLLPKITALASEGASLAVVATALESLSPGASSFESGARDLLGQRGLASRFEIRRVSSVSPVSEAAETTPDAPVLEARNPSALGRVFSATSHLKQNDYGQAVAALKDALELDPDLPAAHYELGKVLLQTDEMVGALAAFRRTTELLPEYASAWGNLGAALGEMRELDDAAEALTRAVALDPLSHPLHSNLGVTYRDQGKLAEAETAFRRALQLTPDFVFGHYNLASVQYLSGRYHDAIASFEKAQSLHNRGSPRQSLMLAVTRLASGNIDDALNDYRGIFSHLEGQMKVEMRTVAEWDLKQLAQRTGVTPALKEAASLLRSLA